MGFCSKRMSEIRRNNKAAPKENDLHSSAIPIAAAKADTGAGRTGAVVTVRLPCHTGEKIRCTESLPDPAQTLRHAVRCTLRAVSWQALLVSPLPSVESLR